MTSETVDEPWWVIYTRHQHEKVIAQQLTAKGFEVFLPLYQTTRQWKDRQKVLELPLFPCYVFIRGGLQRRLHVVTTPGVHMVLSRGEKVVMISEEEMESVRRAVEGPYRVEPHPFLKCGDRVRVKCGPLEGIEGILVRKKNVYRLVISVEMVNQAVAVELKSSDIEPLARTGYSDLDAAPSQAKKPVQSAHMVRGVSAGMS